jgi:hypothetical protein
VLDPRGLARIETMYDDSVLFRNTNLNDVDKNEQIR